MVTSQLGVVATESVLASQVAASILERGGNAIDAAVAANAMMGLGAPMNDGIGGDLFAIVYIAKTGRLHGLNSGASDPRTDGAAVSARRAPPAAKRPGKK
jgi:gamma-glutamyltranspeptidase/glutathione hydrolase